MTTEAFIEVTEGSGKRIHTVERTIGGSDVHDEGMFLAEPVLGTYATTWAGLGVETTLEHLMQLMAGASKPLYIRRIHIYQQAVASSNTRLHIDIVRLTSAGTGGTNRAPVKLDPSDPAPGATAQSRPTAKGTESDIIIRGAMRILTGQESIETWEWVQLPNRKPIVIPAGAANGIAIKQAASTTDSNATIRGTIEFDEGYA